MVTHKLDQRAITFLLTPFISQSLYPHATFSTVTKRLYIYESESVSVEKFWITQNRPK